MKNEEKQIIAALKGRTDSILQFDIAGVFFSAVFAGVLMVPAYFAFNALIPIEHLEHGSTYYFIGIAILCSCVVILMTVIYVYWLKRNQKMRILFLQSVCND
eukprot:jgi/Galph1/261/GphlegSOOS_G5004.1